MLTFPNGKINLGLYITRRREDGYHDLETVFYPVRSVKDALEALPAKNKVFSLQVSGLEVKGEPGQNLVEKAWRLLKARFPEQVPAMEVYLHKAIPTGAGLGGGSADGSFMLRLLNDCCHLQLDDAALETLALQLGSDCPFFIRNTPQLAKGRGEQMTPLAIDLSGYEIRLVPSPVHVSTAKAFSMIVPRPAAFDLGKLPALPLAEWKHHLVNDFEAPVFRMHPELARTKAELYEQGAIYAAMSGSGSAVFGIF